MEESLSEALSYIKEIVERNVLDQEFIKEKKYEICYLIYRIIVTVNRLKAIDHVQRRETQIQAGLCLL